MKDFIIPESEFKERATKIQTLLENDKRDAVLIFSTESEPAGVRYFSDYWPSFETAAVLIPREGYPILLIGPESMTFAKGRSKLSTIIPMTDFRESSQPDYPGSTFISWRELLKEKGIEKLGVAGWHMVPHAILSKITKELGVDNVDNADDLIRTISMRKSENELNCLREAARISEIGFKAVLDVVRPGMTEAQLVGVAAGAMLANGAEATGYPIWCCSGPNSTQAISRPTLRKIHEGEIVHFSVGAKVSGYSASIGRPVVLGKCPEETRQFLQVGLDAENMTIDLMRSGIEAAVLAKKVHGVITEKGYGDTILYGPAHGCGQMECEYPFIETSSTFTLEAGMVFMVDVFLADEKQGFRWEDGVIITEGEAEELSAYKREITII
jgi:Xaa-Pro aminopeptidase